MITLSHYEEHYRTLNLQNDCSWDELRKSYKKQIQSCHPDRVVDDSSEKAEAQEHIKALNLAYQDLSKYYKKYNSLPQIDDIEFLDDTDNATTVREAFTFEPLDTSIHQIKTAPKSRRKIIAVSVITTLLSVYLFSNMSELTSLFESSAFEMPSPPNASHSKNNGDSHTSNQTNNTLNKRDIEDNNTPPKNIKYFTIGSSVGKVMDAQGIPDKSTETIWHYGKSTITFKNGKVSNWYRHKDTPLNIDISAP